MQLTQPSVMSSFSKSLFISGQDGLISIKFSAVILLCVLITSTKAQCSISETVVTKIKSKQAKNKINWWKLITIKCTQNHSKVYLFHHNIILPSVDIRIKCKKQERNLQNGANFQGFFLPGPQIFFTDVKIITFKY